ncbi:hypothetical protein [Tissierella sp. Yu-01]|uniref:hypothetical protein n=1 Tax=Tissierella sp. Yu-01 TaxID=3035694 RepID=UPI00240D6CC2|nr:hypothetical protein [Tissierella sp. Yu-01]WFA08237.1 hypothetical protein P3962_10915 [Tissierella sp. Yu-01]
MKIYTLLLLIIFLLVGCTKSDEESINQVGEIPIEEPAVVELTEEEQREVLKGYYNLLTADNNQEKIIEYIDENVVKLNEENVDEILMSLEEYLNLINISIKEKIDILINYYDYSSNELKSYLDILKIEEQNMFTDGEGLNVDLSELLGRALKAEGHLLSYSNGKTYDRIKNYYIAYITGSIVGTGNQYIYAEDGSSGIKQEVLDLYKKTIEDNRDSSTSEILQLYVENLTKDSNDMNGENVLKFYDELDFLLKSLIK